jgi:hypothetical protein
LWVLEDEDLAEEEDSGISRSRFSLLIGVLLEEEEGGGRVVVLVLEEREDL